MKKYYYKSPVGTLWIGETEGRISRVTFDDNTEGKLEKTSLINSVCKQLDEYFAGKHRQFDLPLYLEGTEFQKKVWQALLTIEYGKTVTYGQIAELIGQPRAIRAVGGANNRNKIAIIIPCHRVIGKDGSLTGYAGGLNRKQYLLSLESTAIS